MNSDTLVLKIPTARQKLLVNFPQDPKGDLRIVLRSKTFNLQKAHLRLESQYFKKNGQPSVQLLEIKENFDEQTFEKVMSCFYGASVKVDRLDIANLYPIVKFLQIDSLNNFIRRDILEFIQHYDLFVVMKIAHKYSDQQIFEVCLEQLERQSFQQINYHQYELLETELSLFKLIIKTHNRHKVNGGVGVSYLQINQLLKDYCDHWGYGEEKLHELKFQLIDKTALTSEEYKTIFLDEAIKFKNKTSQILEANPLSKSNVSANKLKPARLSESIISPDSQINYYTNISSVTNQLTLEMENTFQKKRNDELKKQNSYLLEELQHIKGLMSQNSEIHDRMEKQISVLKNQLKKKQETERQHYKAINKLQKTIVNLEDKLQQTSGMIDKLATKYEQLKNKTNQKEDDADDSEPDMVMSQFLPAHLIGEMMTENKKETPQMKKSKNTKVEQIIPEKEELNDENLQDLDDQELQALYLPRLQFDQEPISSPKKYLPRLADFMSAQGFQKKTLKLLYRRSSQSEVFGTDKSIYDKNSLLFILNTANDEVIGGFISVEISESATDFLKDGNAFIFTLTRNRKFRIKESEQNQAIFISSQYLISFANDLMIANECTQNQSYCSWPTNYEGAKQKGGLWLVGGESQNFRIKAMDVYEVNEGEMDMMIID